MSSNLFIASKYDLKNAIVRINVKFNLEKFHRNLEKEIGHFFYYNRVSETLYYAEIVSIKEFQNIEELKESISELVCAVQFNNVFFQILFKDSIREKALDILKDVYAENNIKMIGDRAFSIYHTLKLGNFPYSRPILDKTTFMVNDVFRDMLLYDNSMIPLELEERKTYAKIVNEDGIFSLTLTNEIMLEVDYQYLLGEKHREIYRPYFYEFFLSQSDQEYLKEKLEDQSYSEELLYEIEIIRKRDKEKRIKQGLEEKLLEGELIFSASPVKSIPAYIKIIHTNKDGSINQAYNKITNLLIKKMTVFKEKEKIEQVFMEKIPIVNKANINYEVKIYNVGQGNWIHILVYEGKNLISKIVFDIGIGSHLDNSLRASITKQAASEIQDKYIFVLSHWDLDHIKGIIELKKEQFETTWIIPELPDNPSNGANRLAAFLTVNLNVTSIFISNDLNGQIIFDNTYFKLGKGKGNGYWKECDICRSKAILGCLEWRRDVSYTTANNLGLILVIKTESKQMLFPGDCEYIQFPDSLVNNQNYDALIVSHHGAEIKQSDLESLGFSKYGTDKFAVVCVGKNNDYPKEGHIKSIESLEFRVLETRDYKDVSNPCQLKLH